MISRRRFAALAAVASAAGLTRTMPALAATSAPSSRKLVKPKHLAEGDTVGIVLPASRTFEAENVKIARDLLEALGFKVKIGKHAFDQWGYFAGRDEDRAADINTMFADPDVDGIFCFTGGWGSPRVLPLLDYENIRRNPKVLIGYSDITALLNGIHKETGLVTFHGPVADSQFNDYTLDNFRRAVMSTDPIGELTNPAKKPNELVDKEHHITTITSGKATGPIVGGNLTLAASLMGTPWELDTDGALVFLEDVHEELYRIDRMLTQLALGGKFDSVKGVVFGRCSRCPVESITFSLEEILRDRFGSMGIPVMYGFAFGHISEKLTLPIGVPATMDADAGTLTIAEAAVV